MAACKRIFSYFEIVAGKVQPPHECPEAITITIQKYKVVRKCIENITLTIPVSFKSILVWTVTNIIYLIYVGSRSEQVREKPEHWTELAGSAQWFEVRTKVLDRTSATPPVEIIYARGVGYHLLQRSTTGLSYLKKRTTHMSSGPSAQWTTVCIISLLYWRENYLIALPLEKVFLVEFLSFRKHLFRTSSSSRMNGFESRFATESMHRAINRVRISSSREWQEFLEY